MIDATQKILSLLLAHEMTFKGDFSYFALVHLMVKLNPLIETFGPCLDRLDSLEYREDQKRSNQNNNMEPKK